MAKKRFIRTRESTSRIVDADLEISNSLVLPEADENGDPVAGAIAVQEGKLVLHDGDEWSAIDASLDEAITSDVTVGGINAGQVIPKGFTFTGLIKALLQKVFYPNLILPTFSLSHQEPAQIEVGTTLTVDLVFNFNRGKIQATWPGGVDIPIVGEATGYRFWNADESGFQIVGGPTYQKQNYVVLPGANSFKADVIYSAGPQPKDSKGNNFGGAMPANISDKQTASFTGVYRHFYGSVPGLPNNASWPRVMTNQLSTVNSFTLNTGNVNMILVIVVAPGKSLSSVVDIDALNAVITSEYEYKGTIGVNDAGGNEVPGFKLYVKTMGVAYNTSHRHQITLA